MNEVLSVIFSYSGSVCYILSFLLCYGFDVSLCVYLFVYFFWNFFILFYTQVIRRVGVLEILLLITCIYSHARWMRNTTTIICYTP